MSGKEYQLAVATASAILDTLGDDDFFNLVSFSDQARVIVPCFQDKMVSGLAVLRGGGSGFQRKVS